MRRSALSATPILAAATPAAAHDAFGDLGPFYQAFLHPLADPAQGLLLAASALLLARHPRALVRQAYAGLVAAALATLLAGQFTELPVPGLRATAVVVLILATATLLAPRFGPGLTLAAAILIGAAAALPLDAPTAARAALLTLVGGALGIALATLWVWGAAEWADRRISPLATSVAAAWIGAIALMAAALPA